MNDETAAAKRAKVRDWLIAHRQLYLRSGGVQGHIMDVTASGGLPFGTHCLIRYVGRKSGKVFITPLCYGDIGGEVVIVGSKSGADNHPEWYLNICASEFVDFQIATQAFRATWRQPEGAEREKVWDFMVTCFPFYDEYQKSTDRLIPLIMMKSFEEIPVFKESDATGIRQF